MIDNKLTVTNYRHTQEYKTSHILTVPLFLRKQTRTHAVITVMNVTNDLSQKVSKREKTKGPTNEERQTHVDSEDTKCVSPHW
jgi:hypothetical protein